MTSLGILNVSDLGGTGDTLYFLEISFKVQPERYRVNQLTTDSEMVGGHSNVNEAMITGEPAPVHKMAGGKIIADMINGDGSPRVYVTATGGETTLAGIMRLVEQVQKSTSKTQFLADKAAGWLFYIALGLRTSPLSFGLLLTVSISKF